jgi:hypothetical protein
LSAGWVCPVDHLSLLYVLDKSSLAEDVYCLSDGGYGSPPRFCAWRRRCDSAFYVLHGAYLGEEV